VTPREPGKQLAKAKTTKPAKTEQVKAEIVKNQPAKVRRGHAITVSTEKGGRKTTVKYENYPTTPKKG
jgi:hypothetical protein